MSRRISFRFDLLRGGAYYARLRAMMQSAPHIRYDAGGKIKMSLTGTFYPWARDVDGRRMEINWLTDEIEPHLVVNGRASPLGVYIPTTPREVITGKYRYIEIEAYDRCQRVLDTNSGDPVYFARGTLYVDAIEQLLSAAGIQTVFTTPNDAVLAEPREWEIGTPYIEIANELLGEINYKSLWFDSSGNAILEPAAVPEAYQIRHTLSDLDPDTLVVPGISRQVDLFNAPNEFVVICANPDKAANMRAVAVNENPQSPLSVPRRGRKITKVTPVNNIASQSELQAYADRLRNDSLITGEQIGVNTGLQAGWGVKDVVALHYGDLNCLGISKAWDMELKVGGRMSHTIERVVYNLE